MKKTKLRYAMVGGAIGSFIGPIHRMAMRIDDLGELVAGCFSRDAAKNAATGDMCGITPDRVYNDWRKLIAAEADKIDFLLICTTNETHYEIAKAALEAKLDVFCEKPLSLTAKEAETLGKIATKNHRVLGIPFTYTGFPMVKLAHDLVAKGSIGKVNKTIVEYMQGSFMKPSFDPHNGWKMNPKIAGPSSVVADIGVHAFTMLEYITGLKATSLLADCSSFVIPPVGKIHLEDDASVFLRMASGAKATLLVSKVATGEENGLRLRVYGSKGSLKWDQERPNELVVRSPTEPDRTYRRNAPYIGIISELARESSRFPAGHHEGFVEALANIYREFTKAVTKRLAGDFPSVREGVRSMRFVEATLKSAKSGGRWIKI